MEIWTACPSQDRRNQLPWTTTQTASVTELINSLDTRYYNTASTAPGTVTGPQHSSPAELNNGKGHRRTHLAYSVTEHPRQADRPSTQVWRYERSGRMDWIPRTLTGTALELRSYLHPLERCWTTWQATDTAGIQLGNADGTHGIEVQDGPLWSNNRNGIHSGR